MSLDILLEGEEDFKIAEMLYLDLCELKMTFSAEHADEEITLKVILSYMIYKWYETYAEDIPL
jgi:hypothetical protein